MASVIQSLLRACGSISKAEADKIEDASDVQLNAFEFRNYRTSLEPNQQRVLERVVNQWCVMLVKGKKMTVNGFENLVMLDKDLLTLEYKGDLYHLKDIRRMEMFKDDRGDDLDAPWALDVNFQGVDGDSTLTFNFNQERQRLNFALSLRILRTRDPHLERSQTVEVIGSKADDEEIKSFKKIVNTQHYSVDAGIPIVFSVSDLKVVEKLQSTSREVYLEFFVRYPRQDKFLYAKSPMTLIPPEAHLAEDTALRKRKDKRNQTEEEKEREQIKHQVIGQFGQDVPIAAMQFALKNVKLKVPKIPQTIFGRLMAKDDYFPTAVGTFSFEVTRQMLQDRRTIDSNQRVRKEEDFPQKDPVRLALPVTSSWKVQLDRKQEKKDFIKIATLTIRLLGYVMDNKEIKPSGKVRYAEEGSYQEVSEDEEEDSEEEEQSEVSSEQDDE